MADPKNVIIEIKNGLADVRQQMNLLKQETSGWVSTLGSGVSRLTGIGGGGSGTGGVSSTLVAPNPKFTAPAYSVNSSGQATSLQGGALVPGGGSTIAAVPPISSATPTGGGGGGGGGGMGSSFNYSKYLGENPSSGFIYGAALTSGMLDQPGESVEAQLLMSRSAYFNSSKYGDVVGRQSALAAQGLVKDKMDVMRGLAAAQGAGISGPNVLFDTKSMGSVAGGVSAVSNLVPGAGFEGTMRAYGSMQQGRSVNMLKGIGIQIRDENGNMKPPDQIINELWQKLEREKMKSGGTGSTFTDVQISLQPGNALDTMLETYFGYDPMAKKIIAEGLLYKAKTNGAPISQSDMLKIGATTEATQAFGKRNAAGAFQTGNTAASGAKGYASAATNIAALSISLTNNQSALLNTLTEANAKIVTYLGAANDTGEKFLALLLGKGLPGALTTILGTAAAGIGASLITDTASTSTNAIGYTPQTAGVTPDDFAKSLILGLGGNPNDKNSVDAFKIWMKKEGQNKGWGSGAAYNPFSTTEEMPGSTNFNIINKKTGQGVQNYTSYDQGLEATLATLTGPNAEKYGYNKIIKLVQSGASTREILDAVSASSWAGSGGYADKFAGITPDIKMPNISTVNYGGVTINVKANSPEELQKALQKHFKDQGVKNLAKDKP